jgi:hypothetical protein
MLAAAWGMVSIAVSVSVKQALNKSILDFSAPATEKPCGSAASLRDDRPAQPGFYSFPMAVFRWLTRSAACSR